MSTNINENEDSNLYEAPKDDREGKNPAAEESVEEQAKRQEKFGEGEIKGAEGEENREDEEKVGGEEKLLDEGEKEGEHLEEKESKGEGENVEGEHVDGEENFQTEGEQKEYGEFEEGEYVEGEHVEGEEKAKGEQKEYRDVEGEQLEGEVLEEQEEEEKKEVEELVEEELVEEEPEYVEEPVDPAAPLNLTESKEALRVDFELRQDQLAQVEKVWALYQDYTPAYSDIDGYVTVKELVYMLKCLFLITYTEEQLMELIDFCVRPKDERGHITYEQFLHMVKIRWRDLEIGDELRSALQVYDPEKTGEVEADELREVLGKLGNKLSSRIVEEFIKEIDISGEGKIGIEDVVAIVGMDLMKDEVIAPKSEEEEEF